ncbi:uncharacterized protein LOC133180015 [Saccostrea echinata]|uniref:uncharacterized protein LOC133180015 n=1 Tax=Saccostrea echinata TaxID=191078 RepID=UPI002A7F2078|nr:uncharacterized protein LOC133180015 [Saccostrea echinata]
MAEEIFNFLAETKDLNSFDEFEEMWVKIGEELEKSACPPSPQRVVTVTPVVPKEKTLSLEPTYSPAHDENWPPATVSVVAEETGEKNFQYVEDSILTSFR